MTDSDLIKFRASDIQNRLIRYKNQKYKTNANKVVEWGHADIKDTYFMI